MVGMHVVGHLARRAIASTAQDEFEIEQLKSAARLYEETPDAQIDSFYFLYIFLTVLPLIVIFFMYRYGLGDVMNTLAMIEQPQTTILERTTVVRSEDGEPDAPLDKEEKEHLIDDEVVVLKAQPITSSIRKTMAHLYSVGGRLAHWRGLGCSLVYGLSHSILVNFLCAVLGHSGLFQALAYIVSSVLLARIHMTWTHIMISKPSTKPWYRRVSGDRETFKSLVLPSAVYATAQMATFALPALSVVALTSGASDQKTQCAALVAGGASMLLTSVLILLPASVTLHRIEASFLPEDEDTIVPFDRTLNGAKTAALTLDGPAAVNNKTLFIEAWRSFDMSCRLRLIKFYIKMGAILTMIFLAGVMLFLTQIYIIGVDKFSLLAQSSNAQLRLAAMGVDQN